MIRTGAKWVAALIVSALVHGAAILGLGMALKPDPVPPQSVPQTRLDMATYRVDRSDAREQDADTTRADEAATETTSLGSVAVPASRTSGTVLPSEEAAEVSGTVALPTAEIAAVGDVALAAKAPLAETLSADAGSGARVDALVLEANLLLGVEPPAIAARSEVPEVSEVSAFAPVSATAKAVVASGTRADTVAPEATEISTAPTAILSAQASVLADPAQRLEAAASNAQALVPSDATPQPTRAEAPISAVLVASAASSDEVSVVAPAFAAVAVASARPEFAILGDAAVEGAALFPAAMPALAVEAPPPPADVLPVEVPADRAETPPVTTPQGDFATAALAWSGDGSGTVDPVSLAAIQAFMQPGDLSVSDASAGRVKDSISAILASVPCARLQTEFRPDTGALELRGHIPEEDLRGPVLAALQAQVGGDIPVADNILLLPRPQCGALAGISSIGLPQSTDQLTDPRVIGPDTHARVYSFTEGQRLTFDLVGADYEAVVYIDYFDAEGMVLHLQPNEIVGLERVAAEAVLQIGEERLDGPSLNITVAPPFGQEIMVAMAASHPLYEGLRPIREPAEAYLRFMTERVAEARETHPDFKGEWVYFFVRTTPR